MEQITTFGTSGYTIDNLYMFDGVTDPIVITLLEECVVLRILHDQPVPNPQGNEACVYVVLRGTLGHTLIDDTHGTQQVRTEKILRGESVGELSVLDDAVRIPLPHVTASFGVAMLAPQQDANGLLAAADASLYRAKEAGHNQVAL